MAHFPLPPFEVISHTGDIKIRAYGYTLKELFGNALRGMFESIGPHFVAHAPPITRVISLTAPSRDMLLVDFLSECLYLSDIHNEVYRNAQIDVVSDTSLKATLHGEPITGFDVVEIKAVTYHDFSIENVDDHLQATIVFDI
jgi:protein archease